MRLIRSFINSAVAVFVALAALGGPKLMGVAEAHPDPLGPTDSSTAAHVHQAATSSTTQTTTEAVQTTTEAAQTTTEAVTSTAAEVEYEIIGFDEEDYDLPPPNTPPTKTTTTSKEVAAPAPPPSSEGQIVVTGSRTEKKLRDTPVPTELVTRKELRQSGAENLGELLEEHPGIELERSTRGSGIRMFGLNPEHTLILIDGQRTTGRVGGSVDPSRFDVNNVEQIEIVKGAGSALYGSEAIGGVINIIPRRPKHRWEAFGKAEYGSQNTLDLIASAGTQQKQLGLQSIFTGGYHRADAFSIPDDSMPTGERTTGAAFQGWNIENRTRYEVNDALALNFRGDVRQLSQQAVDSVMRAVVDRTQRTDVLSVTAGPDIRIGNTGRFRAWATGSDFRLQIIQDQRNSEVFDTVEDIRQRIGQLNLQFDELVGDNHLISLGVEGIYEYQEADLIVGRDQSRGRAAAFIQDEWSVLPDSIDLQIVPSLRVDTDSQFGSAFTPRLAVRYAPVESVILRANYGFGFRAPSFEELYLTFTNPGSRYTVSGSTDLEPERAQALSVAAEFDPFEFLSLSALGFWIEVDDLINTQRGDATRINGDFFSTFQYVNIASARSRGGEFVVLLRPLTGLEVSLGYVITDTLDRATGRPLLQRAKHKGTAQITYEHPVGTTATLRSSFVGSRLFNVANPNDPNSPQVDEVAYPYVTLDLRVQQEIWPFLSAFVGAENLFDVGHPIYLPTRPRSFYGGLQGRFQSE